MSARHRELDEIQRWMQAVIMHPHGVEQGGRSPEARAVFDAPPALEELIERSRALSASERMAIYNNAYFSRLMECLGEQFPVLRQTLGEETFDQFALAYLVTYPSTNYTLGRLGAQFARYLADTRPARSSDEPEMPSWPEFLVDLAELEWAIDEVFDAPGGEELPKLDPERLSAVRIEDWPRVRLVPIPCLRLLVQRFPINDFFTIVRREQRVPEMPAPAESFMALSRRDYVVRRFSLSRTQYVVLEALLSGRTVGDAIELAAEDRAINGGGSGTDDELEQLAGGLRRWFSQWAAEGFFTEIVVEREE